MATHTDLPFVDGGALGVGLFFVLSGFPITTLLLEEHRAVGRIDLRNFWARRALRLVPALLAVLVIVSGYAVLIADPVLRSDLLTEVVAAATYTRDFNVWTVDRALGHTWSLAVEEQFYLLWPLLLVLVLKLRRVWMLGLAIALAVGLAWLGRAFGELGPGSVLLLRRDALLVGCGAALLRFDTTARIPRWFGLLGLLVVVVSLYRMPDTGSYALVGVGTVMLVVALVDHPTSKLSGAFAWGPLVWIGRISYGLYLWHLPIFRWIAGKDLSWPDPALVALKTGLAFLLAILCYALVERPFLRMKHRFKPRSAASPAPALAATG